MRVCMRSYAFVATILSARHFSLIQNLDQRVSLLEKRMNKVHNDSVYQPQERRPFCFGPPVTCGYNLSASVDVLYWRFYEGGNDYRLNSMPLIGPSGKTQL